MGPFHFRLLISIVCWLVVQFPRCPIIGLRQLCGHLRAFCSCMFFFSCCAYLLFVDSIFFIDSVYFSLLFLASMASFWFFCVSFILPNFLFLPVLLFLFAFLYLFLAYFLVVLDPGRIPPYIICSDFVSMFGIYLIAYVSYKH